MKIEVTADDIAKGQKGRSDSCPIALACLRSGLKDVMVDSDSIDFRRVEDGGRKLRFEMNDVCSNFVDDFDFDEEVHPFSFELDLDKVVLLI